MTKLALILAGMLGFLLAGPCPTASVAGSLDGYRLLVLGSTPVKWGLPVRGTGSSVTYGIATRATSFAGQRNCTSVGPMNDLLAASGVARDAFIAEVTAAFEAWSAAADVTFVRVDEDGADIVIGAMTEPKGRAFTNVVRGDPGPTDGAAPILRSVVCLNPSERWKIGFDGDLTAFDLRYTLTHEIGHAIGLDHPGLPGELMDFRYLETFAALQAGDVAGAVALYGPARPSLIVSGTPAWLSATLASGSTQNK